MADVGYIEAAEEKLRAASGSLLVALETLEMKDGERSIALHELRLVVDDLFRLACYLRFAKDLIEREAEGAPSNVVELADRIGPGGGRK